MHDLLIHELGARYAYRRDGDSSDVRNESARSSRGESRPLPSAAEVRLRVRRPTTSKAV